jgi:hypothetical protein
MSGLVDNYKPNTACLVALSYKKMFTEADNILFFVCMSSVTEVVNELQEENKSKTIYDKIFILEALKEIINLPVIVTTHQYNYLIIILSLTTHQQ